MTNKKFFITYGTREFKLQKKQLIQLVNQTGCFDFTVSYSLNDIEKDFTEGLSGIKQLPLEAKFGVFMAYRYYNQLLKKLKTTPALEIKSTRIRVPNYKKIELLTRSYVKYQLNLL